jgi:hypothetical protein
MKNVFRQTWSLPVACLGGWEITDLPFDTSALRERSAAEEFPRVQASTLGYVREGLGTEVFVSATYVRSGGRVRGC